MKLKIMNLFVVFSIMFISPFIFFSFKFHNRHQSSSSSNTLGRFSKSTNRLQTSPTDLDYDYRSAQTLPRKLEHKPMHSSAINIAIVNNARSPSSQTTQQQQQQLHQQALTSQPGPAKPARTYKSINRSKSFNVHGLNGTNDPSPIYMSKLNRNVSHHYRSNPHLNDDKSQLRSPSIVNLISRSQRDLSKIDENGFGNGGNYSHPHQHNHNPLSASSHDLRRTNGHHYHQQHNHNHRNYSPVHYTRNIPADRRAHSLLRTTSDNYRTEIDHSPMLRNGNGHGHGHAGGGYKYGLERNFQREREASLGSRSPLTINKDTAAIIRRNSSSTEDYSDAYHTNKNGRIDEPYHGSRPAATTIVHNFTKKSPPLKNGRTNDAYTSSSNLRYVADRGLRKNSASPVIIEVRRK